MQLAGIVLVVVKGYPVLFIEVKPWCRCLTAAQNQTHVHFALIDIGLASWLGFWYLGILGEQHSALGRERERVWEVTGILVWYGMVWNRRN